jgi:hypothetical protein
VQHRLVALRGADGAGQLLGLDILQQVGDRAGLDGREDLVVVGERGQHDDPCRRADRLDPPGGLDTVDAGQHQVHQYHVGQQILGLFDALFAARCLAHHLDIILQLKKVTQALAHNAVIVDQKNADSFHDLLLQRY